MTDPQISRKQDRTEHGELSGDELAEATPIEPDPLPSHIVGRVADCAEIVCQVPQDVG